MRNVATAFCVLAFGLMGSLGAQADAPRVTLTYPPANTVIDQSVTPTITLQATVTDPDDTIYQVNFYVCGPIPCQSVGGSSAAAPFQVRWHLPPPVGVPSYSITIPYSVSVGATNLLGQTGQSEIIPFTLTQPPMPFRVTLVVPGSETVYVAPASPVLYATASNDTVPPATIDHVDFLDGDTVIGTVATPNAVPTGYAFAWQNAPPGSHLVAARATNTLGYATTSDPATVYINNPDSPPQVTLAAPTTGQMFTSASVMPLAATSTSPPVEIQRVEFVVGDHIVATAFAPPYNGTWTQPPPGNFTVVARAVDGAGGATTSAAAYVHVVAPHAPAVVLTAPAPGTAASSGAPLTLSADALAPDGSIGHVDFYAGTTVVGSAATSPYTFTWASPSVGQQLLTARAYDLQGNIGVSAPVPLTVTQATQQPQTISFGALANKTLGTAPFAVSATASSGLAVSFSSLTTLVCTISGNTVTLVAVGTCTIRASQAGNASFAPAPNVDQSFTVTASQTSQTITFATLADQTLGTAPFTLSATASSGLAVTFSSLTAAICTVSGSTVTLLAAGTCTIRAAQAGNTAFAPAPNVDQSFQVIVSANLTIVTPAANATIGGDFVVVSGTYQGPPNSGVTVNGVVARNDGQGHYFVNNLPLTNGANTLTVTLTTSAGQTTTLTQTITSTATAPMQVYADLDADFAPASFTIKLTNRTANTITNINYSNLGGGQLDTSAVDQTTLGKITYATPGVYTPAFVITDSAGNTYSQTVALLVQDKAALDQMLKAVWGDFTSALAAGNKDNALSSMSAPAQQRYGPVLDALAPYLAQIVSSWSPPTTGLLGGEVGEFAIRRMVGSVKRVFFVYFVVDANGIWRLVSM